jgi:GNAT superfamily N-acetyltransferase|tara:strand:+ start:31 stop:570 length:540 start_codon:yes stop_codon:yes gene_type:complete
MANDTVTKAQIQVTPFDPDTRYMVQALYDIGDAIVKESTTFKHGVMKDKIDALVANHKLYLDDAATYNRTCCYMAWLRFSEYGQATCVGAVAGFVSDSWFDGSTSLNDFFLYVHPEARRTRTAESLIQHYELFGRDVGVDKINLGISTGLRQKALGRFYENAGYQQSATQFTKEINHVL